ncbi:ATP-grasp domain-containing protein [Maribacter polysiphoniae]|uniref:ATP-grasp domain-containing protein n=1 Tax=Maribacter polysiphoniae TaxID=429344 RepID=A0A316DWQ7_9FLAO|nr:ATP-grasp domain-containing protein [Maribacter polysiphoniae]MBD1262793.1 ATP-grasp domain-containing protein [Maribacter polysiphoniae]PWK21918.1 putative ATP-grasp superfamily ATP-dependent carboligase [Maribacter polysiphoniae]
MQNISSCLSILIPDGENELLTNHVKDCFARVPDVRLYVMSNKKSGPSRFSRYVYKYSYYPKAKNELEWIANINAELLKHDIDLIMPIFEDGIRTLIKFKKYVKENHKLVVLPVLKDFEIANNKALLAKHLVENDISGPMIYHINKDNYQAVKEKDFPLLVKPLNVTDGGSGILLFKQKEEFQDYFKQIKREHNFIFQEFIGGYDIDCSVLCDQGDIRAFTIQKGVLYGAKKFAPPIGVQFLYEENLYTVVKKLMKTLNWSGVAHIDLRFDQNDGKFKVIEVNTRYWGSLDASLAAGINFPYLYYLISTNKKFKRPTYNYIEFLSIKGLLKRLKQNAFLILNGGYLWKNTALKFLLLDPIPFIAKILLYINSYLARFFYKK